MTVTDAGVIRVRCGLRRLVVFLCAVVACVAVSNGAYAQVAREKLVAVYVFRLAEHVQWANEARIDRYKFHVIDENREVFNLLTGITRIRELHGKPVDVSYSRRAEVPAGTHLVYVAPKFKAEYNTLFDAVQGANTLLVSDGIMNRRKAFINLLEGEGQKLRFEVNKANVINQNLGLNPDILLLGGTEIDVAQLYRQSQRQIADQEKRLGELGVALGNSENTLSTVQAEIQAIENERNSLTDLLSTQRKLLREQTERLGAARAERDALTGVLSGQQIGRAHV